MIKQMTHSVTRAGQGIDIIIAIPTHSHTHSHSHTNTHTRILFTHTTLYVGFRFPSSPPSIDPSMVLTEQSHSGKLNQDAVYSERE